MGNTFGFISPPLRGHVKVDFGSGATARVCKIGVEGPSQHVAVVPDVQDQPQERLQMEASLRTGRVSGALQSETSAAPLTKANRWGVVDPNSAFAPTLCKLGES